METPAGGVTKYISGTITMQMNLPAERPVCLFCWMLGHDNGLDRSFCRVTDEFILNPSRQRGSKCPIKFNEGEQ